jgi:hypothetical protein
MIDLLLRGVPQLVNIVGVAAATSADLQPAAGEVWLVAWAQGLHDDTGGARVCGWNLNDGLKNANMGPGVSITNGICIPLYQTNPDGVAGKSGADWQLPIVLNEKMKVTLIGVAIGAGKKLYINAMVYKYRAIGRWTEPQ